MLPSAEPPSPSTPSSCLATRMRAAASPRIAEGKLPLGSATFCLFGWIQVNLSALGEIPVISFSIFRMVIPSSRPHRSNCQMSALCLIQTSLLDSTQIFLSGPLLSDSGLSVLLTVYCSPPSIPVAGGHPNHTQSWQGCIGVWSSP